MIVAAAGSGGAGGGRTVGQLRAPGQSRHHLRLACLAPAGDRHAGLGGGFPGPFDVSPRNLNPRAAGIYDLASNSLD